MKLLFALSIPVVIGVAGYLLYDKGARIDIARATQAIVPDALIHKEVTILFTGDLMLDRGVASHARTYGDGSLFAGVEGEMQKADAIVVNLETTLTDMPSVAVPNSMDLRFTSSPRFATLLSKLGVRVATLSNNHTDDFGTEGLLATKKNLTDAKIAYYGSPHNVVGEYSTQVVVEGKKLCFVGYEGFIATDPAPVAEEVRRLRPLCDYVVATMHAGEEYVTTPTYLQKSAAHAFVDAGADVVIGTHPHIVQPLEIYNGKPIFYSLGNFIFDQDFSWNTTHGLLVAATIKGNETTYRLVPIQTIKAEASLITEPNDRTRLLEMVRDTSWSEEFTRDIADNATFIIK